MAIAMVLAIALPMALAITIAMGKAMELTFLCSCQPARGELV